MQIGNHLSANSIIAALIAAGFAAGIAQVLLMRELLVIAYGNELSMGLLLASWLIGGAVGSVAGRALIRSRGDRTRLARLMMILAALPAVLLIASLCLVRAAPLLLTMLGQAASPDGALAPLLRWISIRPGEMLGPAQLALTGSIVALGPAALNGMQFAVGCDLYCRVRDAAAGPAYASDAIGHLVGGVLLATAIVLIADPFTMALLAGAANVIAAGMIASHLLGTSRSAALLGAIAGIAALAIAASLTVRLQPASLQWRWHNHELLASIESIYGNIALMRQQPDGIFVYQSGVYSGASPPLIGTVEDPIHFTMLQHPQPREVLLIGEGITGGLRELLQHDPDRVDYVELDETLFALAERWAAPEDASALADPRVNLIAGDARREIARAVEEGRSWDVILVALPDPATAQLNRFYTVEFYRKSSSALSDGGVIGWQIPGSDGYFSPSLLRLHRSLLGTAELVFDQVVQMPGESAACAGSNGRALTDDWMELHSRLAERGIDAPLFEAMLPDRLEPYTLRAVQREVASGPELEVNTDLRPISYFLDQTWWLTQFRPEAAVFLAEVSTAGKRQILVPLAIVTALLCGLICVPALRGAAIPLAVGASGFAAMALQLALLFGFQVLYGYVYHMVGVIVGAFMVGIAVGAIAADRWLQPRSLRRARQALPVALALMAGTSLLLAPALHAMADAGAASVLVQLVFPVVTALIGLTVGLIFPLAAAAWEELPASGAAAWLYAADLVGAAGGAVLAGAFLAPVIGIPGTCVLAGAIAGAGALLTAIRAAVGS